MRTERFRRLAGASTAFAAVLALGACDLTVTNPGPVQDQFLDDTGAFPAVVNGARRALALGYTRYTLDASMTALEALPGGLFGGSEFDNGILTSDNVGDHWTNMQKGRWVAEDGVRRLEAFGGAGSAEHSELLLLAAYANRSLGHNMCAALIDGGSPGDYMDYFTRAEGWFDDVITQAGATSTMGQQALAGRADVNLWQGEWADALADAQAVTDNNMTFLLQYYDLQFSDSNEMMFRQASDPWREYTVWGTFMEEYYTTNIADPSADPITVDSNTGDPRMAWRENPADPITMVNNLPFLVQLKFDEFTSPHTLASGWEMLLVQAEAILRGAGSGDFNDALALINQVRTRNISEHDGNPLLPYTAANATEAWEALKQERRIELWGENRRFGDLRRWHTQSAPGAQPMEDMSGRSMCFPIATAEVENNQNVPESFKINDSNGTLYP